MYVSDSDTLNHFFKTAEGPDLPAEKMIDPIIAIPEACCKIGVDQSGVVLRKEIVCSAYQAFCVWVGHDLDDMPDMLLSDMWVNLAGVPLIGFKEVSEHRQGLLQGVGCAALPIDIGSDLGKGFKVENQDKYLECGKIRGKLCGKPQRKRCAFAPF